MDPLTHAFASYTLKRAASPRVTRGHAIIILALALLAGPAVRAQQSPAWHDPSKHRIQFVTVSDDVRLEVLDWGGTGRPVVLLAGSGNTAHVFDDFAEKLSSLCHLYGITRRGFGVSSHPDSSYTEQRLADDVLQVLDSLKLIAPVLVGHSMAGGELTTLASQHPDGLAGLVYLDAARDPTRDYSEISKKLSSAHLHPSIPLSPQDNSFAAYRAWEMRRNGFAFPESELRNQYETNPDGTKGKRRTEDKVFAAIGNAERQREYSLVRVPVLAIFALPASAAQIILRTYQFNASDDRAPVEEVFTSVVNYIRMDEKSIQKCSGGVRVVEMPGSDHYVFLASEADVLRELRAFLESLN
ncbi:MAG TPA: alpha/beta hydrolase [Candidatus Acidoferrum sp.]|nr:alpha/beta hydrolase [Candidatus Acidoferrum sp.]